MLRIRTDIAYWHRASLALMVGASLLSVGGCGVDNPLGRLAVSGSVTLDGEALESGTVQFSPRDPAGVGTGAPIEAGRYTIAIEHGLPPGDYDVRITSPDTAAAPAGPPGPLGPPAVEDRIPPRYNTETELSITVAPDSDGVFDFPLESS